MLEQIFDEDGNAMGVIKLTQCIFCGWSDPPGNFRFYTPYGKAPICDACAVEGILDMSLGDCKDAYQGEGQYHSGTLHVIFRDRNGNTVDTLHLSDDEQKRVLESALIDKKIELTEEAIRQQMMFLRNKWEGWENATEAEIRRKAIEILKFDHAKGKNAESL